MLVVNRYCTVPYIVKVNFFAMAQYYSVPQPVWYRKVLLFFYFFLLQYGTGTGAVQKGIPNFLKKIKTWTYLRTVLNQNHTLDCF